MALRNGCQEVMEFTFSLGFPLATLCGHLYCLGSAQILLAPAIMARAKCKENRKQVRPREELLPLSVTLWKLGGPKSYRDLGDKVSQGCLGALQKHHPHWTQEEIFLSRSELNQ